MVLLTLKNEQREHLKILREQSSDTVVDLCKLALDYLINGPNEKKYTTIAKKLNITSTDISSTIDALVYLLIDTIKMNTTEIEFDELKQFGFNEDHISILWQFVKSKKPFIENALKLTKPKELRYRDIDWRFEAKISSRSLLYQSIPIITIKFYLDTEPIAENRLILNTKSGNCDGDDDDNNDTINSDGKNKSKKNIDSGSSNSATANINNSDDFKLNTKQEVLIEIDPNNLVYLINVLEQALLESKTYRARNILKAL